MGYTHYHEQRRPLTDAEWTAFSEGFQRLLLLDGIPPLSKDEEFETPPHIDDEVIYFNGVGDEAHETFVISKANDKESWQSADDEGYVFHFTKTARKDYDIVVVALLGYLQAACPDAFKISSDGEPEDWEDGLQLARQAWPDLDIPCPKAVLGEDEDEPDGLIFEVVETK